MRAHQALIRRLAERLEVEQLVRGDLRLARGAAREPPVAQDLERTDEIGTQRRALPLGPGHALVRKEGPARDRPGEEGRVPGGIDLAAAHRAVGLLHELGGVDGVDPRPRG